VKFATQVDAELLASLRRLARSEGRQLQALIDEALRDLIEKRRQARPRAPVMAAYQSSHAAFAALYRKLAE
jgi:predicted transcriptional regulator